MRWTDRPSEVFEWCYKITPFNVINWDEVADKFDVGVNVDNNDTVVGVDGSDLRACLDSLLPFPLDDSSNFFFNLP